MLRILALLSVSLVVGVGVPAQVAWQARSSDRGDLPAPTGSRNQTACVVADFDRDRRDDFVIASRYAGGKVELWRFDGTAWRRDLIEPNDVSPEAGGAVHDIDGDGDLDLVLGQDWVGNEIYWWENPAPQFGSAWTRRVVKSGGPSDHHDQAFGDVDGDGRTELVSWVGFTELLVFEIPSDPRNAGAWSSSLVFRARGFAEGTVVADVDGDGVRDIVAGGRWFRHQGSGVYAEHVIDAGMQYERIAVGQLVPGGRPEIVLLPGHNAGPGRWYFWAGSTWLGQDLGTFDNCHTVAIGDADGDGALDILAGEMRLAGPSCALRVYYGDNLGGFTPQMLATGNDIHESRFLDFDGDGDLDIVHKPLDDRTPRVDLWINPRGRGQTWQRHRVDAGLAQVAVFVLAGDLDGDGRGDLAAGDAWYRNPGPLGGAWTRRALGWPLNNVAAVHDFDGDGDLDVLGSQGLGANADPRLAWAENDGRGGFTVRTNLAAAQGDFLQGVAVARFGGPTAPLQIALSWHDGGGGVQMLTVPADPRNQPWGWQRLTTTTLKEDLEAGDLDGDGDLDLLLGTHWLQNPTWQTHVLGSVSDLNSVGTPEPDRNELVDLDRDGDLDAVVGLENGREIVWFENPRPQQPATAPWPRRILAVVEGQGFSLDVGDVDRDGDPDVVVGEHRGTVENRMLMLVNEGQLANWTIRTLDAQPASQADHHDGAQLFDLDADGDLDIYSTGWLVPKLWVYENQLGGGGGGGQVGAVAIEPAGGTFAVQRRVVLSVPTEPLAAIHYTLDGSEPTPASPRYHQAITLTGNATVRAKAFITGRTPSATQQAEFARLADLAGRWRFDLGAGAIAPDDVVVPHDGVLVGPTWAAGRVGGALQFDGRDDRVELGTFDLPGTAATMAAWIWVDRYDHLALQDARIIAKARSTWDQDHVFMLSSILDGSPRLRCRLRTNGFTDTLIGNGGTLPAQAWVHVAATYDGATLRLYQNGEQVGQMAKSGPIEAQPGMPVWLGDSPGQPGARPFAGRIDDVLLARRALSPGELRALAQDRPLAGVVTYGRGRRACAEELRIEAQGSALAGAAFGVAGVGAPPQALGWLFLGVPDPTGSVYLDTPLWLVNAGVLGVVVNSTATGTCLVDLSLLGLPPGLPLAAQFAWLTPPSCTGVAAVRSTDGLRLQKP